MSSPGFEPRPYGTTVSVANHYTRWATVGNVAEKDKKRGPATCVQNAMSPCALQHASHRFMANNVTIKFNFFMTVNGFLGKYFSIP
ncbi:UNVERIFIED_CONTAM: hypothetical protein NCL1_11914 [Trichonephila clavipes]